MCIWAIADLHLCFGIPSKTMEVFGQSWQNYTERIKDFWQKNISENDLVLIAGDTSWARNFTEAALDFEWIDNLPGKKVLIKGNHDYWWTSKKKLNEFLPPSCCVIQNDVYNWNGVSICGARLWETDEFNFDNFVEYEKNPLQTSPKEVLVDNKKIFQRELERLKLSLDQLDQKAKFKIAMTHYPPIGGDLKESVISKMFEKYNINISIFGHLHNVKKEKKPFGEKNKVKYFLTSSDYLDFKALKVYPEA